jgi:hypothetical protein
LLSFSGTRAMEQHRGVVGAPAVPPSGKDEMNLAEFPIALLSQRAPRGQKTIEFEDRFYDDGAGKVITRRVTITGSDKYGLPTAKDDEVVLGLIQLTKVINGFTSRTVNFCRSDLIKLLGWPDTGQSYRRLARSFDCLTFAGLSYENAWWDHTHKSWVSEKFHILDRVTFYEQDCEARPGAPKLSSFTWSEVLFQSFRSGYLKRFDFDFYLGLKTSTAKRMYRFLDKRFYLKRQWEFDLKDFARTHVGLSDSYEGGTQLARKLRPAIEELEAKGFLEPLDRDERFVRRSSGEWKIVFVSVAARVHAPEKGGRPAPSGLEAALIERGVTPATAAEIQGTFRAERIRAQIEVFDWLAVRKDKRISKSPGGYLAESIRKGYATPKGFEAEADRARRLEAEEGQGRGRGREDERRRQAEREGFEAAWRPAWDALPEAGREEIRRAVVAGKPYLSRTPRLVEDLCLDELARRRGDAGTPGAGCVPGPEAR